MHNDRYKLRNVAVLEELVMYVFCMDFERLH